MRKLCVHCQHKPVTRPRGLCWGCYYTPEILKQHPSTSKHSQKGEPTKRQVMKLLRAAKKAGLFKGNYKFG